MSIIRSGAVGVAATLLLSFIPMAAGAEGRSHQRFLSAEYSGPGSGVETPRVTVSHDECSFEEPASGCAVTKLGVRDKFVHVRVNDSASGPLVAAVVTVEDKDGHFDFVGRVCGDSMEVPLPIPRGYDYLEVHVLAGACYGTTTPSIPTTGVIELFFTDRLFS